MRIVLLSCAGAPFGAEIMQHIREVKPEILDQIVSVVISIPKTTKTTSQTNSDKRNISPAKRIVTGLLWRGNVAVFKLGVLFRSLMSKLTTVKFRRIEDFCLYFAKETFITENINTPEAIKYLQDLRPDLLIIATFHNILKPEIFSIPTLNSINIHPSYLPHYRGADPINMAIEDRATWTGVTIHQVDAGIDTGEIISQEKWQVSSLQEDELRGKLSAIAARLLLDYLSSSLLCEKKTE